MTIKDVIITGDNIQSYREDAKKAARKFKKLAGYLPHRVEISDVNGSLMFHCTHPNDSEALYSDRNGRMYLGSYNITQKLGK